MSRNCFPPFATAILLVAISMSADDAKAPAKRSSEQMTPQTRMLVIRDLSSERVFARKMFPMGEKGLQIKNGVVTPSDQQVAQLLSEHGAAARPGDRVVITNVIIKEKSIVFEINGGSEEEGEVVSARPGGRARSNEHRGRSAEEPGGERLAGNA